MNDPLVALRVAAAARTSRSTAIPNLPNLKDELAQGCAPHYAINTGTPCPATAPTLWATPQPWTCVAVQTGGAVNQVPSRA